MPAKLLVSDRTKVCSTKPKGHVDVKDCFHHANIVHKFQNGRYLVKSHLGYVRAFDPAEIKVMG